ncbi:MAG TPA: molecular chaperone TorD family protein [Acidimicrobiia bacterium]|nr:molecular chaperone TorD family protein [Acidimicrobiia bacterium]
MSDSTSIINREDEAITSAGRATLYALLAYGFASPEPLRWQIVTGSLVPATATIMLPEPLASLVVELATHAPAEAAQLEAPHFELFPPVAHQDAPAYETAYRGDDLFRQMDLLADVAGFYRAHGLRTGGSERERPDHIVVELEFCSLLCRKELHALRGSSRERLAVCRQTMRSFLADHLACWAPAFGRRVAAVTFHPWYRALGQLLAAWVEEDAARLRIVPAEMADEPLPRGIPDDDTCGPCPPAALP